jgi:hypothetical protein
MASNHLTGIGSESKQLATWYFAFAAIIFGAQLLFGLVAAIQYVMPGFLFEILDFSVARMLHINALVVWMVFVYIWLVYKSGFDCIYAYFRIFFYKQNHKFFLLFNSSLVSFVKVRLPTYMVCIDANTKSSQKYKVSHKSKLFFNLI